MLIAHRGDAQESRPLGLLPAASPLAAIQEALVRGDVAEARAAIDAKLASATPDELDTLGPALSLLRAASEPVSRRPEAMLGVALAYSESPIAEAAAVAGLAALIADGPEVGDLAIPLLGRTEAVPPAPDASSYDRSATKPGLFEILIQRSLAPNRDGNAIEHARELTQLPSSAPYWGLIRPSVESVFPAQISGRVRLRSWPVDVTGALPDSTSMTIPRGLPKFDVTLDGRGTGFTLPGLEPGAWLVVLTGLQNPLWNARHILVSDLEIIAHSVPGSAHALTLLGGKPVADAVLTRTFDPRFRSRTRGPDAKPHENAIIARRGPHVAIAPITPLPTQPQPVATQRLIADVWAAQPVYAPGDRARMRLAVRALPGTASEEPPLRIVLWPRHPHEVVIERRASAASALDVDIPASMPPGPARIQVFDDGETRPAGAAVEPILDTVAFTVQAPSRAPVQLLANAPTTWAQGDPNPRVELLGLTHEGLPARGLSGIVEITAGTFRQEIPFTLDGNASAAVTLALDGIDVASLRHTPRVEVSATLRAFERDLARVARRIEIVLPGDARDRAPLTLAVLTGRPVAGEDLRIAVTGPKNEIVLLTGAHEGVFMHAVVELGRDGRAEATLATPAEAWPTIDVTCSTRALGESGAARVPASASLQVALTRRGAPSVTLDPLADLEGGENARVAIRVGPETRRDGVTLSVAVVDDRMLAFSGARGPDPEGALRPRTPDALPAATASPFPIAAADWFLQMLGNESAARASPDAQDRARTASRSTRSVMRTAADVTPHELGALLLRVPPTAHFEAVVPIDDRGDATMTFKVPNRSATWRVIAVAIDREGRSTVAATTLKSLRSTKSQSPSGDPSPGWPSHELLFLGEAQRNPATGKIEASVRSEGPGSTIITYPFPSRLPEAIGARLDASWSSADHVAARVLRDRATLLHASPDALAELTERLEADLTALRGLKTRDGYAWQDGGSTDFEVTPRVLQALALAAGGGSDATVFAASPEMRDGFLRAAPRALSEANGNPQAALETEDGRSHEAFLKAVPPERRAAVLVETVIGMLAVDPTLVLPKAAVAALVRQRGTPPDATLAWAGLALARAGDAEGASVVRARLLESPATAADVRRVAMEILLAKAAGAADHEIERLIDVLAGGLAGTSWPAPFDAALAMFAIRSVVAPPGSPETRAFRPAAEIAKITIGEPAHCVVDGWSRVGPAAPITVSRNVLPSGSEGIAIDAPFRFEIFAKAPPGPFAIACPLAGMNVLAVPGGRVERGELVWLFRDMTPGADVRVEGTLALQPGTATWLGCRVISLDSLDVVAVSADADIPLRAAGSHRVRTTSEVVAIDAAALQRARDAAIAALREAKDDVSRRNATRVLLGLPDRTVHDAVMPLLDILAPMLDQPESAAVLLAGLDERRSALWEPAALARMTAGGNDARLDTIGEFVRDDPAGIALVTRWRADPESLNDVQKRLAQRIALSRLRNSDPASVRDLWDPGLLLASLGEPLRPDALPPLTQLPWSRHFSLLLNATSADPGRWGPWTAFLDRLEASVLDRDVPVPPMLFQLITAVTDALPQRYWVTALQGDTAFVGRQNALRRTAAARAVEMIEAREIAIDAVPVDLLATWSTDLVPRLLRFLESEIAAGRGDTAIPAGVQLLSRRSSHYYYGPPFGPNLAAITTLGPEAWRLPAALATHPKARVPLVAVERLLKDAGTASVALDMMFERNDATDLLRHAIELPLPRYEIRRILDHLAKSDTRPFRDWPIARVIAVIEKVDTDTARTLDAELVARVDDNPADVASALASARGDRVRDLLLRALAKAGYTDIPWEADDPAADRFRVKMRALGGDGEAADVVRAWMAAAARSALTQGAPDTAVRDLWPALVPSALPKDVMLHGPPDPPEMLAARAAQWSDEDIRSFLTSADAAPDPSATGTRLGSVATVVRLIGAARAAAFGDELLALWRAYLAAGLSFDALSIFGHMGTSQPRALREVLAGPLGDSQKLSYVAALRRDPAVYEAIATSIETANSDEIVKALARFGFEATGYWKPPAFATTRPAAAPAPHTPQDWQRALATRLRHQGLSALDGGEPQILRAWEKTLRERGLFLP